MKHLKKYYGSNNVNTAINTLRSLFKKQVIAMRAKPTRFTRLTSTVDGGGVCTQLTITVCKQQFRVKNDITHSIMIEATTENVRSILEMLHKHCAGAGNELAESTDDTQGHGQDDANDDEPLLDQDRARKLMQSCAVSMPHAIMRIREYE